MCIRDRFCINNILSVKRCEVWDVGWKKMEGITASHLHIRTASGLTSSYQKYPYSSSYAYYLLEEYDEWPRTIKQTTRKHMPRSSTEDKWDDRWCSADRGADRAALRRADVDNEMDRQDQHRSMKKGLCTFSIWEDMRMRASILIFGALSSSRTWHAYYK